MIIQIFNNKFYWFQPLKNCLIYVQNQLYFLHYHYDKDKNKDSPDVAWQNYYKQRIFISHLISHHISCVTITLLVKISLEHLVSFVYFYFTRSVLNVNVKKYSHIIHFIIFQKNKTSKNLFINRWRFHKT